MRKNNSNIIQSLCVAVLFFFMITAQALSLKQWDGHFIHIPVKTNQEILIYFPNRIQIKMPAYLRQNAVLINNHHTLLIKPFHDFNEALLEVRLFNARQDIVLLSLSAHPEGLTEDIRIILPESSLDLKNEAPLPEEYQASPLTSHEIAVSLLHKIEKNEPISQELGLERIPMHTRLALILNPYPHLLTFPLGMWRYQEQYLTVLFLKNLGAEALDLKSQFFDDKWKAVIFSPQTQILHLAPYFSDDSQAYLVLISDQPFEVALAEQGISS